MRTNESLHEELSKIYNSLNENIEALHKILIRIEKEKDFRYPTNIQEEITMHTIEMWIFLWEKSITDNGVSNRFGTAKEQLKMMVSFLYKRNEHNLII